MDLAQTRPRTSTYVSGATRITLERTSLSTTNHLDSALTQA